MLFVQVVLAGLLIYLACGVLVGVPFVTLGVGRVDEAARGASLAFRLLILPGSIALWPWLAVKWHRAAKTGGHP
jgi:hypothetical protein